MRQINPWTDEEEAFLRSNYKETLIPIMAERLGRTRRSVEYKLKSMGLRLTPEEKRKRFVPPKTGIGSANPNWKGGISKNHYHYKLIQTRRYPDRVKARAMVNSAIRNGKMKRGSCEVCGEWAEAHHFDYSKPLDVRWFCPKHHDQLHRDARI